MTKPTAPIEEGFAGVPAKRLKSLANRIGKVKHGYKISEEVAKLVGDAATPQAVMRHLVTAGHLDPMPNGAVLSYLARCQPDDATADAVAEALARRDESGAAIALRASAIDWMVGWPAELDALVYRAYAASPAAFAGRAHRYAAATRRGLAFVARRRGEAVDPAAVVEVLAELARAQATGYGISGNSDCPFVDDDGREVAHSVDRLPGLRVLALRVGAAAEWDRALLDAARRNEWGLVANVTSALEQLPLDELTRLFATRSRMFGDDSDADEVVAAIMDRRDDPPEALLGEPAHTPATWQDMVRLRAVYAAAAERKLAR
ncbi:MAG: hypothetical protein Q8S73_33750 [Deltaproteobacteria bacterium]|nr:hypothetical protein [Myxococcales bacterium]MDP3219111.1 hypothetical protein [Deltaproteobacteria bacterium]